MTDPIKFIEDLKTNIAYAHIDMDIELAKMDAWLSLPRNKRRQKTPRFIINWLNKLEKPLEKEEGKLPSIPVEEIKPEECLECDKSGFISAVSKVDKTFRHPYAFRCSCSHGQMKSARIRTWDYNLLSNWRRLGKEEFSSRR